MGPKEWVVLGQVVVGVQGVRWFGD
jgi:hypothetical protein